MNDELRKLATEIGTLLTVRNLKLVTAESCTGGLVAAAITAISGSSKYFERGFITYSNESKKELLGVPCETLEKYGAVSAETAIAMAAGALSRSRAQVSIAITGIAGPTGGSKEKPIGTVYVGLASNFASTTAHLIYFSGNREAIRLEATKYALQLLAKNINVT